MIEMDYPEHTALPLVLPAKRSTHLFDSEKYRKRFEEMVKANKNEKPKAVLSVGERWSLTKSHEACSISMTVINALDLYHYYQQVDTGQVSIVPRIIFFFRKMWKMECALFNANPVRTGVDIFGRPVLVYV